MIRFEICILDIGLLEVKDQIENLVFFHEKYVKNFPVSVDAAIMSFVHSTYISTVRS